MSIRPPRASGTQLNTPQQVEMWLLMVFAAVRALAEQVLQDTTEDLRVQCSRVEQAFSQRCAELTEAKIQLEMKLAQVDQVKDEAVFILHGNYLIHVVACHCVQILEQIGDQEANIVSLEQAIHHKEAPLRVAQSRLYLRSLRPNMELCRDQAQLRYDQSARGRLLLSSFSSFNVLSSAVWKRRCGRSVPRWRRWSSS